MSKPKPRRKHPGSLAMPAPDVPREALAKPGEPGYWFPSEQYVGVRITCRACGKNRRVGLVGLYTFDGDDGEPWFEGAIMPGPEGTSLAATCREGHPIRIRNDRLFPLLEQMRAEVGPGGRRVVDQEH